MEKKAENTTKGGSCRLEKSHKVWMMMMIAEGLMWVEVAGAAQSGTEKLNEQIKTTRLGHNEP